MGWPWDKPKRKRRSRSRRKTHKRKRRKVRASKQVSSGRTLKNFNKLKKELNSINLKHDFPLMTSNKNEKFFEQMLYTYLGRGIGRQFSQQAKRKTGIVDMSWGRIGIELKLNRDSHKRIAHRLVDQARRYSKKFDKLIIFVVNFPRKTGESNSEVKRKLWGAISDLKSVGKRDVTIIVKSI